MRKVLFVCTVPALESYSIGVIKVAFKSSEIDAYASIMVNSDDQRSKDDILKSYQINSDKSANVQLIKFPEGKFMRIMAGKHLLKEVEKFGRLHGVNDIHFISQDVILHQNLKTFSGYRIFYTVHDLVPHQARLPMLQRLKHYYFRIRKDQGLVKKIANLVTNSHHQKLTLEALYPDKKIFFHEMPGLITPEIIHGTAKVPELIGVEGYILFFGRIEVYKGLEMLYNKFVNDPFLSKVKLVIAGRGSVYFNRDLNREQNITIINRFIADEEINDLFEKASLFIMPYLSSTQSAVSSLAYHFNLPIVATNIPGLNESISEGETGLLYDVGDEDKMAEVIEKMLTQPGLLEKLRENIALNNPFYNQDVLQQQLDQIYC